MEFQSIEEIKEYFGITAEDESEIRKELKIQISKVHSDKTGGSYKSKKQQKDHDDLSSALNFIDKMNGQIVLSKKDWDLVVRKIDDLVLVKINDPVVNEIEYTKRLDESINSSIVIFQKQHYFVKISSTILAGLLTIIWTFPSIVEKHKILKHLVDFDSSILTYVWLAVIIITCIAWIFTKNSERKDELIKKRYILDSTQNSIFKLFIAWINVANLRAIDYDHKSHTHITYFTKDDLMRFIFNFYEEFSWKFATELPQVDLNNEVSKTYKDDERLPSPKRNRSVISLFFNRPGEIDMDLAQKISDIIIEKLLNKKMIIISDKKTFSETYRYDFKYI